MDSKEEHHIQQTSLAGASHSDEGPYYHESWWESYKGGVKGKLGGVFIGALVGAAAGVVAATALSFLVAGGVSFLAVTAGFAAAGMLYEVHEFSNIGTVTGAVAAAHEKSEERMKAFEEGKFNEIKQEIGELKSAITGKPVTLEKTVAPHDDSYESSHVNDEAKKRGIFKPIFWKIAAIGLAIGMAAGALLAAGGISEHILHALGAAIEPMSELGKYAASMTVMGIFGASYGVNRDIFRHIFDKTDHLFKGILHFGKSPEKAQNIEQATVKKQESPESPITTVVFSGYADYPQSDTHHRDKVLTQAKNALLSMDHTKAIPN